LSDGEGVAGARAARSLSDAEEPPGAAPAGRMPDFFVVGQPKSGTTALFEMLRRHPQIYMPPGKEPWFMAEELLQRTPPRPGGTPRTLAEYARLFEAARPEQRVGEASALYLWSRTAAARIAAASPDARIVAILREPASLLRSLHLQFVETHIETETDLRRALALEQPRREGRELPQRTYWPQTLLYSEHVRYVEQLRRFHERFPREHVLVLIYDDLRADNEAAVREVMRFLEVDDTVAIDAVEANPSVQVRNGRLYALERALSLGEHPLARAAKASLTALTPARLRRVIRSSGRRLAFSSPERVDEQLMAELRERYRPEVAALGEYLDRDLVSLWGAEDVG